MRKIKRKFLRSGLLFTSVFLIGPTLSYATEVRILKVQGDHAVVQILDDTHLEKNDVYHLEESSYDSEYGAREYNVGLSGEASSLWNTNQTNTNTLTVSGKFGWNHGWYEFGPNTTISSVNKNNAITATYSIGLFVDFDFRENRPGRSYIPGLGFKILPGTKLVSSGSTSSYFNLTAEAGPKFQFFLGHSSTSLRVDIVYHYEDELDYTSNKVDDTSGVRILLGVESYF